MKILFHCPLSHNRFMSTHCNFTYAMTSQVRNHAEREEKNFFNGCWNGARETRLNNLDYKNNPNNILLFLYIKRDLSLKLIKTYFISMEKKKPTIIFRRRE